MIVGLFQTTILSLILFPFFQRFCGKPSNLNKLSFLLIFLNNVTWHSGYHFHLQEEKGDPQFSIIILSFIFGLLYEHIRSEINLQGKKLEESNEKIKELNWKLSNWRLIYKKKNDNHLREIINIVDDIKEKISDGSYLKLMDNIKEIYENSDKTRAGWWDESFEFLDMIY
jgi:hypothetical protein